MSNQNHSSPIVRHLPTTQSSSLHKLEISTAEHTKTGELYLIIAKPKSTSLYTYDYSHFIVIYSEKKLKKNKNEVIGWS